MGVRNFKHGQFSWLLSKLRRLLIALKHATQIREAKSLYHFGMTSFIAAAAAGTTTKTSKINYTSCESPSNWTKINLISAIDSKQVTTLITL